MDMQNEGAVEAIMQLLSLLTAQYPVWVEVDDSNDRSRGGNRCSSACRNRERWKVTQPIFTQAIIRVPLPKD